MRRTLATLATAALALTLTTAPAEAAARVCNSTASEGVLAAKRGGVWRDIAPGACASNVSTIAVRFRWHGHAGSKRLRMQQPYTVLRPTVVAVHSNASLW